ncbi:virus protein phiCh1-VP79 (plasmid) [Natrialba magadii ATCC 43099]|uniref:Virus protein phiCh1-VP79 n=1 Tax=Natrialba magadii (strain ATCC 43099 / DSM 3394 / CCM 3739 / CIP 104546 / IAM 13178 / JCM 8861 / NBRC 102185 / NCIMB 2190 / MS3) TaxID=547559 RepID=D3T2D1_NATMM|nr:hypothetical protein [Natrialba magadii]ADD07740.1 virus protein phiCh1-VP79 [Natrialba magadii ATCC 43099]
MTNLTDFGVEVGDAPTGEPDPQPETDPEPSEEPSTGYPNGRCPAIANGTRRCQNPVSRMNSAGDYCGTHANQAGPVSIDSHPELLVRWLGNVDGRSARCRAIQGNGERCTNDVGPLEYFCGMHEDVDCEMVDDLDDDELDVELIRTALHTVAGLEDEPLTVSEDGIWLPEMYRMPSNIVIRTPTATHQATSSGDGWRKAVYPLVNVEDWDSENLEPEEGTDELRNPECVEDGPKVGLKVYGGDQRWFPVEIVNGGDSTDA